MPSSGILKKWKILTLPLVTTLSWTYFLVWVWLWDLKKTHIKHHIKHRLSNSLLSLETEIQYSECQAQWVGWEEYREEIRTKELVRIAEMKQETLWWVQKKQTPNQILSFPEMMWPCGVKTWLRWSQWGLCQDYTGVGITFLMDQTELIPCYLLDETCGPHTKDLHVTSLKNKLTQQRKLCNFYFKHDKPSQFILFVIL